MSPSARRERELVMMRWGMVPHFVKSLADFTGLATINAKAESLMKNAVWRIPFQRRRCLTPSITTSPYPIAEAFHVSVMLDDVYFGQGIECAPGSVQPVI